MNKNLSNKSIKKRLFTNNFLKEESERNKHQCIKEPVIEVNSKDYDQINFNVRLINVINMKYSLQMQTELNVLLNYDMIEISQQYVYNLHTPIKCLSSSERDRIIVESLKIDFQSQIPSVEHPILNEVNQEVKKLKTERPQSFMNMIFSQILPADDMYLDCDRIDTIQSFSDYI